jgi:hypothetical protein
MKRIIASQYPTPESTEMSSDKYDDETTQTAVPRAGIGSSQPVALKWNSCSEDARFESPAGAPSVLTEVLRGFPQSPPRQMTRQYLIRPHPLDSTSFPKYSIIILLFDAIYSEILKASLNKLQHTESTGRLLDYSPSKNHPVQR